MSGEKRTAVIELFKTGKKAPAISKLLGIPRQTVYDAIKRYCELGTTENRPKSGRPVTATTPENRQKVRCRIDRNSEQSMRKMARAIGISKDSVRKIVKRQLGLRCYKPGTGHYLDDRMRRMPKKFAGENSKSAVARARKEAVNTEKREKEAAAKEDAYWADNDKHVQKKQQRKEEEERKRQQALERKQQNKEAYEAEMKNVASSASSSAAAGGGRNITTKVTLAQLQARREAEEQRRKEEEARRAEADRKIVVPAAELPENINRLELDDGAARGVEEAIKVLDAATGRAADTPDKHPEKRARAAYITFEERRLPELKKAHPTFRLSQLKQLLKKEWLKSPENPLNEKILNIIG